MAEVTSLVAASMNIRDSYVMEVEIDMAEAATAKGSALAAADTINAFDIPSGMAVLFAGLECTEAPEGGTGTILDLGVKSGDTDAFVDGFDFDNASEGEYADLTNTGAPILFKDVGTIDLLIQAATTVPTSGKVRVFAYVQDSKGVGSMEPDVAVRDYLA